MTVNINPNGGTAPSSKAAQPLYEAKKRVFAKKVEGRFRNFKWLVLALTLGAYFITPWLRWDRGEYAPDQGVLLDLAARRFYFFPIEIWPQEFYYVAGLLVMAGFGLFLVTSAVGRAWCGYTCPQTVWVDLFIAIERFFQGDRNARMKLDSSTWSLNKTWRIAATHATWLLISVATGMGWIFYFGDAPVVAKNFFTGDLPFVAYGTVLTLTATTYIFGGLLREQVCIYMCPWPRIQAAMLDEKSLVVTYNDWRGEPRTRGAKKAAAAGLPVGDCVDCNACVAVCPMGIDIRDGQQLGCITCALCIDACDNVMDKVGKERGLIAYATLEEYESNMSLATSGGQTGIQPQNVRKPDGSFSDRVRHFDWRIIFRPRTLLYIGAWSAVGLAMLFVLVTRDRLNINVLHDRNPQYVMESDGSIRNGYTVRILNMVPQPRTVRLSIEGLPRAAMKINGYPDTRAQAYDIPVKPDEANALKVFVTLPKDDVNSPAEEFRFSIVDPESGEHTTYKAVFNGPSVRK
ncbi:cytochrome c oxidase accessory protein CcoG [Rhizobiaceae bacterium BDR2-2]|uniref:Cytochrome c oxidase accessory protein CcoG n=1 Tax=Ectorhizobium quercum TaxID=2965071 RepID=A0AAE3SY45_9HYPH|nr:cytochrome c oxidase accessory protein CcoG [Ectorhizobium quercum]MCX8999789.1 cytochrome c oxidase accessory protein CcoG [Ectorhizobium quercum]